MEIERSMQHKPFLGGYRHRNTGAEFFHASAQTRPKSRKDSGIEKNCRETQTVQNRNVRQQSKIDTSTQMTMIGCYVSNMTDKLMVPGKYQTAEEYHDIRLKKVRILSSNPKLVGSVLFKVFNQNIVKLIRNLQEIVTTNDVINDKLSHKEDTNNTWSP